MALRLAMVGLLRQVTRLGHGIGCRRLKKGGTDGAYDLFS